MKTITLLTLILLNFFSVHSSEECEFIKLFTKSLRHEIAIDKSNLTEKHINEMEKLIDGLEKNGYASISGEDAECRVPTVTLQGAMEELLAKLLYSKKIQTLEVLFLTSLPCTPLRKQGHTGGLTSEPFDAARQYTLDKREHTVRKLLDAGAIVNVAYSLSSWIELKSKLDSDSQKQVKVYLEEVKRRPGKIVDCPLKHEIPAELVGACYKITDKNGDIYYLATRGIQAANAKPGIWEKWFGQSGKDNSAEKRAKSMIDFSKG